MGINQEERQYLSVPFFRRVFELERSNPVLKDIGKDEEPSLSCQHSTSLLHAKLILLEALEIFDASMIILGQASDNNLAKITRSLCNEVKDLAIRARMPIFRPIRNSSRRAAAVRRAALSSEETAVSDLITAASRSRVGIMPSLWKDRIGLCHALPRRTIKDLLA